MARWCMPSTDPNGAAAVSDTGPCVPDSIQVRTNWTPTYTVCDGKLYDYVATRSGLANICMHAAFHVVSR